MKSSNAKWLKIMIDVVEASMYESHKDKMWDS